MFKSFQYGTNHHCFKQVLTVPIISLMLNIPLFSQTVSVNNPNIPLSSQEQADLNQGKVILKGEKGEYIGQVVATGNIERAWEVLTDYNNFKDFLPNISDSKIIQANGDRTIFEQISLVDLLLLTKQFTVQIAATKTHLEKIDFEMIKGDLKNLQGHWKIKKISANQVLITHRVTVAPKSQSEATIFYGIYESSLEETLQAIAVEIGKRSQL